MPHTFVGQVGLARGVTIGRRGVASALLALDLAPNFDPVGMLISLGFSQASQGKKFREFFWRPVVQGAVRTLLVVILSPTRGVPFRPCIYERSSQLLLNWRRISLPDAVRGNCRSTRTS